jgi:hypothetical protein
MMFAMISSHGLSFAVQQRFEEAADWSVRATREPNAHFHIYALATACLSLSGDDEQAAAYAQQVLMRHPAFDISVFARSFPTKDPAHSAMLTEAMAKAGLPTRSDS